MVSCGSDDETTTPVIEEIPEEVSTIAAFEITVDVVNFYRAMVTWEATTSNPPSDILYDVYLNNTLLEAGLEVFSYELEALEESTSYTVKVIAKNDIAESASELVFNTPERKEIRLVEVRNEGENTSGIQGYEYNKQGYILHRDMVLKFNDPSIPNWEVYNHSYTYENDKVVEDRGNYSGFYAGISLSARANYTYHNNQLSSFILRGNYDGYETRRTHTITSATSYSYVREQFDFVGLYETVNYSVDLIFNGSNQLIGYEEVNVDSNQVVHNMTFEYENGDLTKITQGAIIFEIQYDTANNFLRYTNNGFVPLDGNEMSSSGFHAVVTSSFPFNIIRRIPFFLTHQNTNNPIAFLRNGVPVQTFEYEYNEYNYPSTLNFTNNSNDEVFLNLTYEEIE
jgi:hypothetical protein